jgi:hypothetical protein
VIYMIAHKKYITLFLSVVNFCHVSTNYCAAEDADAQRKKQELIERMPFVSVGDKIRLIITKESSPAKVPDQYVKPVALGMFMRNKLIPSMVQKSLIGERFDPQVWQEVAAFVGGGIKYSDCKMHNASGHLYSVERVDMSEEGKAQVHIYRDHGRKRLEPTYTKQGDDGGKLNLFVLYGYQNSFSTYIAAQLVPNMEKPGCRDIMIANALRGEPAGAWLNSLEKIEVEAVPGEHGF